MMIYSVLFALRRGFANATIIIKHRKNRALLSITHLCAQDNARHRKNRGWKIVQPRSFPAGHVQMEKNVV